MTAGSVEVRDQGRTRRRRSMAFDNLKVVLIAGVIVGHTTMAWTGVGDWVFDEPHVRDPLFTLLVLLAVLGALFAIPTFFAVAGAFTPASLERKGPRRFVIDRTLRLGVPLVFFVVFLSPIIEYVDPGNEGWDQGFLAFIPHIWWPLAPGPTWFLGVLLVFSAGWAAYRSVRPRMVHPFQPPRLGTLAAAAVVLATTSYAVRFAVPLGVEVWRLALGQAPAWIAGFSLGAIGGERGWFTDTPDRTLRAIRLTAWAAATATVVVISSAAITGTDIDTFAGGGTWQSFVVALFEAVLVLTMPLWLVDLFRRRFDHQGPLLAEMSRAAYAAFLFHQLVLVGLVLASRLVPWPPELHYFTVALLSVGLSFLVGSAVLRIPGVSRFV